MTALIPPQVAPSWTLTPEDVRRVAKETVEQDTQCLDKIARLPASECNFDSVSSKYLLDRACSDLIHRCLYVSHFERANSTNADDLTKLALALREAAFEGAMESLSFYQNVSPSKELRDAANEAASMQRDQEVSVEMRIDLFQAKQAALKNIEQSAVALDAEEQRLVRKMLQDGTRAGLALPEDKREELSKLKKELSATCLQFIVSLELRSDAFGHS